MSPTELTAVIAAISTILGAPGFVAWTNRRKTPSVTTVANMYKEERDRLEKKVDTMVIDHAKQMADLRQANAAALAEAEARWQRQHEEDQAEIRKLRDEIGELYRRLYQPPMS
jgi:gas vesicle protein